jgi:hypothetical protein
VGGEIGVTSAFNPSIDQENKPMAPAGKFYQWNIQRDPIITARPQTLDYNKAFYRR